MIRGTTPSIKFHITSMFEFETIEEVWITLKTWETEETFKYSATEVDIDAENKTITISLSQEDTLAFEDGTVELQLRLLDTNHLAYATDIFEVEMKRILKDGVISAE